MSMIDNEHCNLSKKCKIAYILIEWYVFVKANLIYGWQWGRVGVDSLWGKFTPSLPLFVGVDGVGIPREHDSESKWGGGLWESETETAGERKWEIELVRRWEI